MAMLVLAFAIAFGVLVYLMAAGAVFMRLYRPIVDGCKDCRAGIACWHDHWMGPFTVALVWPVLLPVVASALFADPARERRKREALTKRITELEKEAGLHG